MRSRATLLFVFLMTANQFPTQTKPFTLLSTASACLLLAFLPSGCAVSDQDGLVSVPVSEAMASMKADRQSPEKALLGIAAESSRQREAAPVARRVPRGPGMVFSPHTNPPRTVDVSAFKPGARIVCPYTSKLFRTPQDAQPSTAAAQPSRARTAPVSPPEGVTAPADNPTESLADRDSPAEANDGPAPFGTRVPGRTGFVYSPYGDKLQLVDVSGIAPGVRVECPYSKKEFRVPPEDQTETASAVPQTSDLPLSQETAVSPAPEP
jgi:hypothetical protein